MDEETSPILIELKTPEARQSLIRFLAEQKREHKYLTEEPRLSNPYLRKFQADYRPEEYQQRKAESDLNYNLSTNRRICSILNNPHTPPHSPTTILTGPDGTPQREDTSRSAARQRPPFRPIFRDISDPPQSSTESHLSYQRGLDAADDESRHAKKGGKKTRKKQEK